jgi:hypothetical protein
MSSLFFMTSTPMLTVKVNTTTEQGVAGEIMAARLSNPKVQ